MATYPEPPVFTQPVSATLAVALGQAVAGFLRKEDMYFVATSTPDENGLYRFWGPYDGWSDVMESEQEAVVDGIAAWFGPFTNAPGVGGAPNPNPAQDTVKVMQITPQSVTGGVLPTFPLYPIQLPIDSDPVDAPAFDAVFLSAPAVRKFVVPYYAGLYGAAFAEKLTTAFADATLAMMVHLPWSEYEVMQAPDGTGPSAGRSFALPRERFTFFHRDIGTGNEGYNEYHVDTPPQILP